MRITTSKSELHGSELIKEEVRLLTGMLTSSNIVLCLDAQCMLLECFGTLVQPPTFDPRSRQTVTSPSV